MDAESVYKKKTLNIFNFTTAGAMLMKLTTNMYLNKVSHLAKSWGVTHRVSEGIYKKPLKMSQKISFFSSILTINTSIKTVRYLMHHLACHHWSEFQTKMTISWGVLAIKTPKSSLKCQYLLVRKHNI